MRFPSNVVTAEDTRYPASGQPDKCLYCSGKLGQEHDADCVCIQRPVKVRLTFEIIITTARSWDKDEIEFHANESSWCSDNIMSDLERYTREGSCLCPHMKLEYIGDATLEEAVEHGLRPDSERDEAPVTSPDLQYGPN